MSWRYREVYWKEVTMRVRRTIGATRVTDPATVRGVLDSIFDYMLQQFEQVVSKAVGDVSFLMFVHRMHESSVLIADLFHSGDKGVKTQLTEADFKELPVVRRVLKLIMEAVLPDQLEKAITMEQLMSSKTSRKHVPLLEELLYLGLQVIEAKEFINIASMFEKSIALVSTWKALLSIRTASPYHHIFDTVQRDIAAYPNVEYEQVNAELDAVLHSAFGCNLTEVQKYMPGLGTGIIGRDEFLNELGFVHEQFELVRPFYAGLTLSAANKLPLIESFKKMQTNNRLIYRPFIEFNDQNGNTYWLVGSGKTLESIRALQTNALLWGQLPPEWTSNEEVKAFVKDLEKRREALMIEQLIEQLVRYGVTHDNSITSLLGPKNQGFNIVKKGPGEIDIIFLDEARKVIYVCECKNNRPRFEVFYWKSEYKQFVEKYEPQLERKHSWIIGHKDLVQGHFSQKFRKEFDFSGWAVEGLFLLMTPSFYKYDGSFKALTVVDFEEFLDNDFVYDYPVLGFQRSDESTYTIEYPYFKNVHRLIAEGVL
ncbi:hypothetical protein Q5H93_23605 [Hymenobacter sp. ASUV-10]|uniref:NERD domain-containing protein n=1 Tax=Hymenobacter aranciens TaxID=3063996 RepID=A0ABT9BHJ5_9BACT|nr:hypothetical protein [Hymenobacter sp. ASUV-10]MDO7877743.1 hypothetical protein [Hymenobacter sp. ASUV-10]